MVVLTTFSKPKIGTFYFTSFLANIVEQKELKVGLFKKICGAWSLH